MANIKIKRGSGVPAGLTYGELAYDVTNRRLYVGVTAASVLLANTDGGVASFNGSTGAVTGVSTFNGSTGAVTGVTTGTANTFGPLQSFTNGISASGGTFATIITTNEYVDNIYSRTGGAQFNIDTTNRIVIGDVSGSVNATTLTINDSANTITANGAFTVTGNATTNVITSSGIIRANAGISAAGSTFSGQLRATAGISASGGTFGGNVAFNTQSSSGLATFTAGISAASGVTLAGNVAMTSTSSHTGLASFAGGLSAAGGTFSGNVTFINGLTSSSNINLQNTEYLQNTTNGRVDIMPAPAGSTAFGMYLDLTSWSFGVVMGTIRSSDGAINTGGNLRFDVPLTVLNDTQLQMGQDGQYSFYRSTVGNDTGQIRAYCDGVNNSGAWAIVGYFDSGTTNRSPTTKHANPNLYIYANGTTSANDFIRFEHDRTNGNIVSGGTTGILIQPGSGQLGISGGISAGAYILNSTGITTLTGTTYTFLSTDNGEVLVHNSGSASTLTVPTGLPIGFSCTVIHIGTGSLGFTSASGVTLNSWTNKYSSVGQHATIGLISYATNTFNLSGGLT